MSLPYGAELTIGGTINLGNYENIRFEVKSPIRDMADLDEMIGGWSEALGRLGRGDPQTAAAVDSFIRRVIGEPIDVESSTSGIPVDPVPTVQAAPVPVKVVEPVQDKPLCEVCGKQISEKERRTSKLFVGQCLCDPCTKVKAAPPEGSR